MTIYKQQRSSTLVYGYNMFKTLWNEVTSGKFLHTARETTEFRKHKYRLNLTATTTLPHTCHWLPLVHISDGITANGPITNSQCVAIVIVVVCTSASYYCKPLCVGSKV